MSGPVPCADHPDVETRLRCSRCGRPICPRCSVRTPVGMRCPDCAGTRSLRRGESRENAHRRRRRTCRGDRGRIGWGFFPEWQFYWALLLGFGTVETMVRLLTKRQGSTCKPLPSRSSSTDSCSAAWCWRSDSGSSGSRSRSFNQPLAARALPAAGAGLAIRGIAGRHRLDPIPLRTRFRVVAAGSAAHR